MTLVGSFDMQICHFQPGVKGPCLRTGPADFEEIDLELCSECNPHSVHSDTYGAFSNYAAARTTPFERNIQVN